MVALRPGRLGKFRCQRFPRLPQRCLGLRVRLSVQREGCPALCAWSHAAGCHSPGRRDGPAGTLYPEWERLSRLHAHGTYGYGGRSRSAAGVENRRPVPGTEAVGQRFGGQRVFVTDQACLGRSGVRCRLREAGGARFRAPDPAGLPGCGPTIGWFSLAGRGGGQGTGGGPCPERIGPGHRFTRVWPAARRWSCVCATPR